MWVGFDLGTENERYLPKYPVGLPLIYAGALKLGGPTYGLYLVYLVNPIAMALSLVGVHPPLPVAPWFDPGARHHRPRGD